MSSVLKFKTCFSDVLATAMVLMQLTGDVWERELTGDVWETENWPVTFGTVTFGRQRPAKTNLREDEDAMVVSVQLLHHIQHEDELATRLHQRVALKHAVGQLWCLLSQHKGHRSTREQALSQEIVTGASYCFMNVLIKLGSEAHWNKSLAALNLLTDGWVFRQSIMQSGYARLQWYDTTV